MQITWEWHACMRKKARVLDRSPRRESGGEGFNRGRSIRSLLRYPTSCQALFSLLLLLLLFIEPKLLGFVGGKRCCWDPPTHNFLFSSLGKAAMSPVITGCVFEVDPPCLYSVISQPPPPSPSPARSALAERRWLVSSLSGGHSLLAPGPVCVSVYLSALVCRRVCPSSRVTLLLQCGGPRCFCFSLTPVRRSQTARAPRSFIKNASVAALGALVSSSTVTMVFQNCTLEWVWTLAGAL